MSSLFFPAFLEMSQSALGAFMVLIHFHWINLCLTVHIHLSTSFPACSLLCFPRARTRTFVPKTASLPLYATLVQTHPGLPHRHGYYQQSLAGFITLWLSVFKIYRLAPCLLASTAAFYLNELFVLHTPPQMPLSTQKHCMWGWPRRIQGSRRCQTQMSAEDTKWCPDRWQLWCLFHLQWHSNTPKSCCERQREGMG